MKQKVFLSKLTTVLSIFIFISINITTVNAQSFKVEATSGSGTPTVPDVIGIYIATGSLVNGYPSYVKISGTNNNPSFVYCFTDLYWNMGPTSGGSTYYYYFAGGTAPTYPTFPIGTNWSDVGGLVASLIPVSSLNTVDMTFVNGSVFIPPTGTPGTNNNPIGRFQLTGSAAGGFLQAVTISLTGTRSGINNLKLWSSADNSFNSGTDTQLSSKADGSSVTFDGFNSLINNTAGTYYFITMDLAAGANGHITASIPNQASFTFASANAPASFTNAPLSSRATILPVELTSFNALIGVKSVSLNWQTATEVNNYGFEILRTQKLPASGRNQKSGDGSRNESVWEKIGFVKGNGNSNSLKQYAFIDEKPLAGNTYYRLKQIDNDGTSIYSQEVMVKSAPSEFALTQNYPNPFNPVTKISYSLPEKTNVKLTIYDVLGKEVVLLVNNEQENGVYDVEFDGANLNSGVYFYKLETGKYTQVKKLMLIK